MTSKTATTPQATSTSIPPLTLEALKNAEYDSEFPKDHKAKLTDGKYQEEYQPGAATKLIIQLYPAYAIGDLNGDNVDDAAVILVANPGGSGTFYHLAAVVNQGGMPKHVASQSLGDRIQVKSISIKSGEIVLDMVVHGPSDPLCCPTLEVTRTYKLQGDRIAQVSALSTVGTTEPGPTQTPTVAPRQSQLAYVGSDGAIWVVNADGGSRRRLGGQCYPAGWLAWSPNGEVLACKRTEYVDSKFTSAIVVVDLAGSVVTEIGDVASLPAGFWPPDLALSPDGTRIAYRARDNSINVVTLATGSSAVVWRNAFPLAWPFAERLIIGTNVLWERMTPGYEAFWLDLRTGATEPIPRLHGGDEFWLSPDGKKAVLESEHWDPKLNGFPLLVYDLATGAEWEIPGSAISCPSEAIPPGQLAISGDSTQIYWANATGVGLSSNVYRANINGSGLTLLGAVPSIGVSLSGEGVAAFATHDPPGSPQRVQVKDFKNELTIEIPEARGGGIWRPLASTE